MQADEPISNPEQINISSETETPVLQQPVANRKIANWLLVGLVVLLLSSTGLFAFKYYELKQQIDRQLAPSAPPTKGTTASPSPVLSPKPTTDQTANWKEFKYPQLRFKIKLPPGWSERGGSVGQPYVYDPDKKEKIFVAIGNKGFWEELDEGTTIDLYTFDLSAPNHRNYFEENLSTADSIETVKINGKIFKKYSNVAVEIGPGSTKDFTFWTLEEAGLGVKFMIGDRFAGSNLGEDLIRQILLTFQFTN